MEAKERKMISWMANWILDPYKEDGEKRQQFLRDLKELDPKEFASHDKYDINMHYLSRLYGESISKKTIIYPANAPEKIVKFLKRKFKKQITKI